MLKDRLTRWNGKKYVLPQGHGVWRKIAERLAAYENSGVEPDKLGSSLYEKVPSIDGSITVTLTEEERCVIANALSRSSMNAADNDGASDNFLRTCWLICKIGGHDIQKEKE